MNPTTATPIGLDPLALVFGASGPAAVIVWILLLGSLVSWTVIIVKIRQLRRWRAGEAALVHEVSAMRDLEPMRACARKHADAPSAAMLERLCEHRHEPGLVHAVAEGVESEQRSRLFTLMPVLSSVASSAPFVGLLGTVVGILDAFLRIGQEKSASLPVVAPAIGEALIVTALGLFAAIPAAIAYNFLSARLDDLAANMHGSSRLWIGIVGGSHRGEER